MPGLHRPYHDTQLPDSKRFNAMGAQRHRASFASIQRETFAAPGPPSPGYPQPRFPCRFKFGGDSILRKPSCLRSRRTGVCAQKRKDCRGDRHSAIQGLNRTLTWTPASDGVKSATSDRCVHRQFSAPFSAFDIFHSKKEGREGINPPGLTTLNKLTATKAGNIAPRPASGPRATSLCHRLRWARPNSASLT